MRSTILPATVLGAFACAAAPALAWSERPYTQPATDEMAIWAYPARHNYCPAGLQPVVVGGVICCGQPTHAGYQSNNHPRPRRTHQPKPYVAYSKSYSD